MYTQLGIPKSTLSGWFKDIKISNEHKVILHNKWLNALVKAREHSVVWHNNQKQLRLKDAEEKADLILSEIKISNNIIIELALAILYLGEGFKKNSTTGMGNSDPLILKFFIKTLDKIYGISPNQMTCYLHLRADQSDVEMKKYWSSILNIPIKNFRKSSFDQRTKGIKTYDNYKGVCIIRCYNVAIERKLVYLSRKYCQKVIDELGG